MHNVPGILVPLGSFAMVVAIVWLVSRSRMLKTQARVDFHKQMLDKFTSGQEHRVLRNRGKPAFL